MPASLPCRFTDAQLAYVESLPDDLGLLTSALDSFDAEGWRQWIPLTHGIAGWSSHIRDNHGHEVAFLAELMLLLAQSAPYVRGWEFHEIKRLYESIEGFWRA